MWSHGVVSGDGSLTKVGTGQLILEANNTYTGQTNANVGALQIRHVNALGTTAGKTVVANGAILQTRRRDEQERSMSRSTLNGSPDGSNGALQVIDPGTSVTVAGAINLVTTSGIGGGDYPQDFSITGTVAGNGGLVKYGPNKLTLTNAANSYSGGTTVNAGLLAASSTAVPGAITVNSGGAFSPGNSVGSATTGAASWNNGGKYVFEIDNATGTAGSSSGWDLWNISGNLSAASTFIISAITESSDGVAGTMANFNNANSYTWLLAQTIDGGTMPSNLVSLLSLDGSGFQNALAPTGRIYLTESGDYKSLYLNYSPTGGNGHAAMFMPIPEPGTLTLLAVVGIVLGAWFGLRGAKSTE